MRLLSARLSAKRRSPFAGLVVLLMGLLVTGGLYAVLSPATAETSEADQSTVAQGRALFLVGCASCHGKNGEGIVTKRGTQYGPPLAGVGAAAVDFQVGTGRMPMARPGVQAPAQEGRLHPRGDHRPRGVRRLPRPRPGCPPARSRPTPARP